MVFVKLPVLKSLANPPRIFFVPYPLAVLNFALQFIVFIIVFVADILANGMNTTVDPVYFAVSLIAVHCVLIILTRNEPQLANVLVAKMRLFTKKIPDQTDA